jgi:hypothetical protein
MLCGVLCVRVALAWAVGCVVGPGVRVGGVCCEGGCGGAEVVEGLRGLVGYLRAAEPAARGALEETEPMGDGGMGVRELGRGVVSWIGCGEMKLLGARFAVTKLESSRKVGWRGARSREIWCTTV